MMALSAITLKLFHLLLLLLLLHLSTIWSGWVETMLLAVVKRLMGLLLCTRVNRLEQRGEIARVAGVVPHKC